VFPVTGKQQPAEHVLKVGEILFVLGANGTGKSSLLTKLYAPHAHSAKRIAAHRQTWFTSNVLNMTPHSRVSMEAEIRSQDSRIQSRHVQQYAEERTSVAIFDLIDAENVLARRISDLVRAGDVEGAKNAAEDPAPLARINKIMRAANLPIELALEDQQKVVARKNGGDSYSVAELSDGERNAFLIAADVLTAKGDTLIFIDEPERHLHRSIISPLLTLLFHARPDCAFVVSTHELMLPIDNPSANTLLVRSCRFQGGQPLSWDADFLPANAPVDEALKLDILGGREQIIFVEGTTQSLDAPLYSLLFPQISIIPKANCREVEYAVRGLRGAEGLHWVMAYGIVDNDQREPGQIEKLRAAGIFALSHYSVEALYYHPTILTMVCDRMGKATGRDAATMYERAVIDAVPEANRQKEHFVSAAVERQARRRILSSLPTRRAIKENPQISIHVDVSELWDAEVRLFDDLVKNGDLEGLLVRYPLRECGALGAIAAAVGLADRNAYEDTVRAMVQKEPKALAFLRGLFRELADDLGVAEAPKPEDALNAKTEAAN
jgi:ABC-type cobalamin/Fe3+-siderophores transport system ATPase subunit